MLTRYLLVALTLHFPLRIEREHMLSQRAAELLTELFVFGQENGSTHGEDCQWRGEETKTGV
jgi:hypothetical protein